jgi:hypothetical protein
MRASDSSSETSRAASSAAIVAVWTFVLGLTGCLPGPACEKGTTRCEGGQLERCAAHPGGIYGPLESPHHVSGSGPDWENVAACGADRCIESATGSAFCALDDAPSADCAGGSDYACAGTTLVSCNEGYAIERKLCGASCDATFGTCKAGTGDACSAGTCGGELQCNADPFRTCELPCECPEGAACAACDASWAQAPDGGASLHWTCASGLCAFHY